MDRFRMRWWKPALVLAGIFIGINFLIWVGGGESYGVQRGAPPRILPGFIDTGDSRRPFSIAVGTTTPVYLSPSTATVGNYAWADREVRVQNLWPFQLYCGTFSAVSATSGPRFIIFSSTTYTSHTITPLWCIYGSAAGSGTKEVIGEFLYDSAD